MQVAESVRNFRGLIALRLCYVFMYVYFYFPVHPLHLVRPRRPIAYRPCHPLLNALQAPNSRFEQTPIKLYVPVILLHLVLQFVAIIHHYLDSKHQHRLHLPRRLVEKDTVCLYGLQAQHQISGCIKRQIIVKIRHLTIHLRWLIICWICQRNDQKQTISFKFVSLCAMGNFNTKTVAQIWYLDKVWMPKSTKGMTSDGMADNLLYIPKQQPRTMSFEQKISFIIHYDILNNCTSRWMTLNH